MLVSILEVLGKIMASSFVFAFDGPRLPLSILIRLSRLLGVYGLEGSSRLARAAAMVSAIPLSFLLIVLQRSGQIQRHHYPMRISSEIPLRKDELEFEVTHRKNGVFELVTVRIPIIFVAISLTN